MVCEQDEQAVIRCIQQGDSEAFAQLVDRHKHKVFGMVAGRVPAQDVETVAQDAFLHAYRSLPGYSPDKPFEHWLARIVVRRCCDYWRSHSRYREVPHSALSRDQSDWLEWLAVESSHERFVDKQALTMAREVLDLALAQLDAEDRALITMVYLEGWTLREAAETLHWSLANAKVRAMRARRTMRAWLTEQLENDYDGQKTS